MKTLTYLALALSIIALVVGLMAYSRAGGVEDIKTRIGAAEQSVRELEARVAAEAQAKENELNTQAKLLEAKGEMLRARMELEINQDREKAVEAVERAREKLVEARTTAGEAMQARIDQLSADIDTMEQKVRGKATEAVNELQTLLDEWEVRLPSSAK